MMTFVLQDTFKDFTFISFQMIKKLRIFSLIFFCSKIKNYQTGTKYTNFTLVDFAVAISTCDGQCKFTCNFCRQ